MAEHSARACDGGVALHYDPAIARPMQDGPTEALEYLFRAGERIRYSNPSSDTPCEYWAVCAPAFSPDTVRREAA